VVQAAGGDAVEIATDVEGGESRPYGIEVQIAEGHALGVDS
jgi:hypothetical protein